MTKETVYVGDTIHTATGTSSTYWIDTATATCLNLEKGEDGYYVVTSPDVKGLVTQGKTKDEAIKNGMEALALIREVEKEKK